jgi:hypothetical protein
MRCWFVEFSQSIAIDYPNNTQDRFIVMELNEEVALIGLFSYTDRVAHFRWKDATGLRPERTDDDRPDSQPNPAAAPLQPVEV